VTANAAAPNRPADLSLVMPCYNEQGCVGFTVPGLVEAFRRARYRLELVAVDNGSVDSTGEMLRELAARYPEVVVHRVDRNEGYGNGLLAGFPLCTAPWIGIIPADGQVDPEDTVFLFRAVVSANRKVLGKARRRFRMDGLARKVVSVSYNAFAWALWPGLESLDLNGNPKILPRDVLHAMDLKSRDWLLDPEIMIKAHYMGLPVLEFNVFSRMRGSGLSHVRASTCWQFFTTLLRFRFSPWWRRDLHKPSLVLGEISGRP
jgi:glycosyltransferase involved in cell wall biosynthesis